MTTMTETTRDLCWEHAKNAAGTLDELWERMDTNPSLAQDELDELPLEIVWEKGEPFAIVLGTGGPHIEIRGGTRHDGSTYAAHVYWSGEHVTYGHASEGVQRTGEYFREQVEGL